MATNRDTAVEMAAAPGNPNYYPRGEAARARRIKRTLTHAGINFAATTAA
ncbi:hypothetical protein JVX93_09880 [Mycolicibacterium boenickei]|nr:hypothetical protein JVX93_09880 [Mycolicibacterium boenickei]